MNATRFDTQDATAILERTPAILEAWLSGLPASWTKVNEGGDSWSAFDIVGHLIHGERTDWIPRARLILEGDGVFEPFDRFAQRDTSRGKTLEALLDEFSAERAANVATLCAWNLGESELVRTGTHPEFGSVTLGEHLSTWVAHDLTHLAQIARVMARRQRDLVGPWSRYLPLLG